MGKIKCRRDFSILEKTRVLHLARKGAFSAPFRTWLTILGVAVGTFALTAMGSMAVHFHRMARRFEIYAGGKLFAREEAGFFGGGAISEREIARLSKEKEIREVIPIVVSRLETKQILVLGLPKIVVGIPLKKISILFNDVTLAHGSWPRSRGECVLGADIPLTGSGVEFRYLGHIFRVSGVMARTNGQEDDEVVVSLHSLEDLLGRQGLVSYAVLIPSPGLPLSQVASQVAARFPHLQIIPPRELEQDVRQDELLWDALTLGTGLLASLVGGIGILTVMMMAAQERIREIAIAKAIGASHAQIFALFLAEALTLSLIGTLLGFLFGLGFVYEANRFLGKEGIVLFEPTLSLLLLSFVLAVFLSLTGGLYPAWYGSRIRIAPALRR